MGAVDNEIDSGVPEAEVLLRFCDAAVGRHGDLAARRTAVATMLGPQATVDAAATIANYQRMVRIADGCGIPLDDFTNRTSVDWRGELGLHQFASAANTR